MSNNLPTASELDTLDFPVWGTQGGGLARRDRDLGYVWFVLPDWYPQHPELKYRVGDPIPQQWDIIPANEAARILGAW